MFDALGAVLFGSWFVLTVLNQLPLAINRLWRRFDRAHLVPRWTFFAPNPGTADHHLLYRDFDAEQRPCTDWVEIPLPARKPLCAVWNPEKRARKALTDIAQGLMSVVAADEQLAPGSLPYIALLQAAVAAGARDTRAEARQFAVVQTFGFEPDSVPVLLFRSVPHPFGAPR